MFQTLRLESKCDYCGISSGSVVNLISLLALADKIRWVHARQRARAPSERSWMTASHHELEGARGAPTVIKSTPTPKRP